MIRLALSYLYKPQQSTYDTVITIQVCFGPVEADLNYPKLALTFVEVKCDVNISPTYGCKTKMKRKPVTLPVAQLIKLTVTLYTVCA